MNILKILKIFAGFGTAARPRDPEPFWRGDNDTLYSKKFYTIEKIDADATIGSGDDARTVTDPQLWIALKGRWRPRYRKGRLDPLASTDTKITQLKEKINW